MYSVSQSVVNAFYSLVQNGFLMNLPEDSLTRQLLAKWRGTLPQLPEPIVPDPWDRISRVYFNFKLGCCRSSRLCLSINRQRVLIHEEFLESKYQSCVSPEQIPSWRGSWQSLLRPLVGVIRCFQVGQVSVLGRNLPLTVCRVSKRPLCYIVWVFEIVYELKTG